MSNEDYSVQRRYPRHRVRIPLFVSLPDVTFRKLIPIHSRDISAGGIGFETGRQLPLDSRSSLILSGIGDLPAAALIEGVIAYSARDDVNGRYSVGIEFAKFVNVVNCAEFQNVAPIFLAP